MVGFVGSQAMGGVHVADEETEMLVNFHTGAGHMGIHCRSFKLPSAGVWGNRVDLGVVYASSMPAAKDGVHHGATTAATKVVAHHAAGLAVVVAVGHRTTIKVGQGAWRRA